MDAVCVCVLVFMHACVVECGHQVYFVETGFSTNMATHYLNKTTF